MTSVQDGGDTESLKILPVQAKTFIVVQGTLSAFAVLVYVAVVALITLSKAYRMFVFRLMLYLSLAGALQSLCFGLMVAEVETTGNSTEIRHGWPVGCLLINLASQYCGFAKTVAMVWICFYVFVLIASGKQMKERRHEIAGVVVMFCVPLLFSWEPIGGWFLGTPNQSCWLSSNVMQNHTVTVSLIIAIVFLFIPYCLLSLAGCVLIVAGTGILIRGMVAQRSAQSKRHHQMALKEIVPLLLYPGLNYLVFLFNLIAVIVKFTQPDFDFNVLRLTYSSLVNCCSIALLLALFLHSSFRRLLCDRQHDIATLGKGSSKDELTESTTSCQSVDYHSKDTIPTCR